MSSQRIQIAVGLGLALFVALAIIQGCGKITGEISANQPPYVEFVNVPESGYGVDTTNQYGMPFVAADYNVDVTILDMQGAVMVENSERVYALNTLVSPPDTTAFFTRGSDYEMGSEIIGEDTVAVLRILSGGTMIPDSTYYIDFSFTIDNYYVLSNAPTVYWKGSDPDGFVAYYSYADASDPAFISAFRADPGYFFDHQQELTWVDTTAMSARIYLLTTTGDTTEHVVFIKAVDNLGKESNNLAYKTFYRTNNPPNNPQIKPLESPDTDYDQHYVVADTLFSLNEITPLWQGIFFDWRSDDPDDKELYKIPLEFSYYLIKAPGDTLWDKSDSSWSETNQIQLYGLETGSYTFSVWVRDDGLTTSAEPATIDFNVVKPTFNRHILLIDETWDSGVFEAPGDSITAFYWNLLESLQGSLDNDNYTMDGVDVKLLDNSDSNAKKDCPIPYALIGQYKLVMIFGDDHNQAASEYINNRDAVLADYLDVGGRLWYGGRRILSGEFGYSDNDIAASGFISDYMQVETGFASNRQAPTQQIEFIGALPVIPDAWPELQIDPSKVAMIFDPQSTDSTALMEVDWFTRSDDATTLYTFNSNTADTNVTSPYIHNEDSEVLDNATEAGCIVQPLHSGLLEVYRVENITKGVVGSIVWWDAEQIHVSYQGEPWSNSDVLEVDYKYDPISEMHLKPVVIRYEAQPRITNTVELAGQEVTYYTYVLGYRTALFAFPLFFMDNSEGTVTEVTRDMLNWFFYPEIHF